MPLSPPPPLSAGSGLSPAPPLPNSSPRATVEPRLPQLSDLHQPTPTVLDRPHAATTTAGFSQYTPEQMQQAQMEQMQNMGNMQNMEYMQNMQAQMYAAMNGQQGQMMMMPYMQMPMYARMPLPSEMVEEQPTYVNAKQYRRIIKRRQARAKLESRKVVPTQRKNYLHESRHQHACRRPRGPGGRFLTKDELVEYRRKVDEEGMDHSQAVAQVVNASVGAASSSSSSSSSSSPSSSSSSSSSVSASATTESSASSSVAADSADDSAAAPDGKTDAASGQAEEAEGKKEDETPAGECPCPPFHPA